MVAVPLTAPMNTKAAAENSAARRGGSRPVSASTIGSTTQGSTARGQDLGAAHADLADAPAG